MATTVPIQQRIEELKKEFERLKKGKESLLVLIEEAEIPESVYNSNAIENSTLTLKETEKILLELTVSRDVSVREIFETKNLARVAEYVRNNISLKELNREMILFLHQMFISGIDDDIAGRFRKAGEYVRVGAHIALAPEHIEHTIDDIITSYVSDNTTFFTDKIALFHLRFEIAHPFNDGNGRIGRAIMNYQLQRIGFPPIIIRDKEKLGYYHAFQEFKSHKKAQPMEKVVVVALLESLHKRITYLKGESIIDLVEYARAHKRNSSALLNAAKRQTIPAFREKGVWKIGEGYKILL